MWYARRNINPTCLTDCLDERASELDCVVFLEHVVVVTALSFLPFSFSDSLLAHIIQSPLRNVADPLIEVLFRFGSSFDHINRRVDA